jgi:hypothetical protein
MNAGSHVLRGCSALPVILPVTSVALKWRPFKFIFDLGTREDTGESQVSRDDSHVVFDKKEV